MLPALRYSRRGTASAIFSAGLMTQNSAPSLAKKVQYWSPRYIWNRLTWSMYQSRNADKPWLTQDANRMLATLLCPDDVGIEWGSGRSTQWFARHVKRLVSIESHVGWYDRVKKQLAEQNITNVDYRLLHVEDGKDEDNSPYVRVIDSIADNSLGFALVDGFARGTCASVVLPKLKPGGILIVDNAHLYLDVPTHSPMSQMGKGPRDEVWRRFSERVKDWRMIWTTSGVSDTAFWIKPCE
jgi:hypothetical protein